MEVRLLSSDKVINHADNRGDRLNLGRVLSQLRVNSIEYRAIKLIELII